MPVNILTRYLLELRPDNVTINVPAPAKATASAGNSNGAQFIEVVGTNLDGSSQPNTVVTITDGCNVGDVLIVALSRTISALSDSQGNTWSIDKTQGDGTGSLAASIGSCTLTTALNAGDTVTVTTASNQSGRACVILRYQGITSLDSTTAIGNAAGAANATSGSVTGNGSTGQPYEVAFGVFGLNAGISSPVAGAGYTIRGNVTTTVFATRTIIVEELLTTSTGTQTATLSWTGASSTSAYIVAPYKAVTQYATVVISPGISSPVSTATASSPSPVTDVDPNPPVSTATASSPAPTPAIALSAALATATGSSPTPSPDVGIIVPVSTASANSPPETLATALGTPVATASGSSPSGSPDVGLGPPPATATAIVIPPDIVLSPNLSVPVATASAQGNAPVIVVTGIPPPANATASALAPATEIDLAAAVSVANASSPTPFTDDGEGPPPAIATASAPAPTVVISVGINPPPATATASVPVPAVVINYIFFPPAATATATALPPSDAIALDVPPIVLGPTGSGGGGTAPLVFIDEKGHLWMNIGGVLVKA